MEKKKDFSLISWNNRGLSNILSENIKFLRNILISFGFEEIENNEIVSVYNNFSSLNVSNLHESRMPNQTFYLEKEEISDESKVLRTQTTSYLNNFFKSKKEAGFSLGKVYRYDSIDPTHSTMFHQFDLVRKNSNLKDLVAILKGLLSEYFKKDMNLRFRPSFFPFTSPSFEIDIKINNRWLEIGGAGILHPNVLKLANLDFIPIYAAGIGIERLVMIKNKIEFLSDLYNFNEVNNEI